MLTDLRDFLRDFYDATLPTEGLRDSINRAIPMMDFLLGTLESGRKRKDWKSKEIHPAIETAWEKLDKYYKLTDQSPVYAAAVVLDPRWIWAYFKKYWSHQPTWIRSSQRAVLNLWRDEYQPSTKSSEPESQTSCNPERRKNAFTIHYTDFDMPTAEDEYELYINEPRIDKDALPTPDDPLSWWLEPVQQKRFPVLSRMALDLLSIPAMSSDTERLFSDSKQTVTQLRNSLQDSTLQILQCLRSWNRSSLLEEAGLAEEEVMEVESEEVESGDLQSEDLDMNLVD